MLLVGDLNDSFSNTIYPAIKQTLNNVKIDLSTTIKNVPFAIGAVADIIEIEACISTIVQ